MGLVGPHTICQDTQHLKEGEELGKGLKISFFNIHTHTHTKRSIFQRLLHYSVQFHTHTQQKGVSVLMVISMQTFIFSFPYSLFFFYAPDNLHASHHNQQHKCISLWSFLEHYINWEFFFTHYIFLTELLQTSFAYHDEKKKHFSLFFNFQLCAFSAVERKRSKLKGLLGGEIVPLGLQGEVA